jgi:hypothetical protein
VLDDGQQRAHCLDGEPDLSEIALVLGARRQAGAPHAEVDQRDDLVEQDLLDPDLLDLGLIGGPELFFGWLIAGAHALCSP